MNYLENISNRTRVALIFCTFFAILSNTVIFADSYRRVALDTASVPHYVLAAIFTMASLFLNYWSMMTSSQMIEFGNSDNYYIAHNRIPKGHFIISDLVFIKTVDWVWFCLTFVLDGAMGLKLLSTIILGQPFTLDAIDVYAQCFFIINVILIFHIFSPFPWTFHNSTKNSAASTTTVQPIHAVSDSLQPAPHWIASQLVSSAAGKDKRRGFWNKSIF